MRRETPPERDFVRLQNDKAPSKADVGGQRRALVAALFLVDLNDDVLSFLQDFADVGFRTGFSRLYEILRGNFLEWQEAVPFGAVVDESRFETGLDAGNLAFVDIGFLSFAGR